MPTAIVTGSDSGIGKATAVLLAERGFDAGITWHEDDEGARDTASEVESHGRRAEVRRLDLSEVEAGPRVVGELVDALGGLDVFVNNAGTGHQTPFLEVQLEEWQRVLDVDLTGAFLCAQEAARRMMGGGSRRADRERDFRARARAATRVGRVLCCEGRSGPPDEGDGGRAGRARHHSQ